MSKHRHKDKGKESNNFRCQQHGMGNNFPFGINPQQLLGMLGGMDIGGLGNILSSMNREGFDLNSMNQQMNNGFNFNNMMNTMNNMRSNQNSNMNNDEINNMNTGNESEEEGNIFEEESLNDASNEINSHKRRKEHKKSKNESNSQMKGDEGNFEDENLVLLRSLRNIVDQSKVGLIDKIIDLYLQDAFKEN